MQNLVLFGFMGTGKSLISKKMARVLRLERVDMDSIIEERQKKSINDIFAEDGEPFFRELERQLTIELSQKKDLIIATGGGVVLNEENIRNFSKSGVCVRLDTSAELIFERVKIHTHRPLLQTENPLQTIKTMLASREEQYAKVPYQVVTDNKSPDEVCSEIMEIYNNHTAFIFE